jgi:moderate conductance mechanosensitive channel
MRIIDARQSLRQGMTRAVTLAVTPLNDIGVWARGNGLEIVLLVLGAILLARFIRWLSARITERVDASATETDELVRSEAAKHRHALIQVVTWTVLVLLYTATAMLVVQRFGVPLTGFIAPATVAGVALGFGAQRIVQDLLAGFFLIAERQYGFGDLVRISVGGSSTPVLGTVEDVSLRITTVRSANGEVIITPNGQTVQVTNLSRGWARAVIDVPVPVTVDVNQVSEILRQVGDTAFKDEELYPLLLDPPSVMGVESIEMDQFKIRMVARTLPGKQFEVGRGLRVRIAAAFLREGITVQPGLDTAQPTGTP